jgi:hypothetical protein
LQVKFFIYFFLKKKLKNLLSLNYVWVNHL